MANSFCRQTPALLPVVVNGNKKYYFWGKFPLKASIPHIEFNKVISVLQSCCCKTCSQRQEQAATQNSAKEAAHSTRQIFNSSTNWRIFLHLHCLSNSQAWWPRLHKKKYAEHRSFTIAWHRTRAPDRMIARVVLSNAREDSPFTQNSSQSESLFFIVKLYLNSGFH